MTEQQNEALRIVAISGSLRATSYTRMALHMALEGAKSTGAEVDMIDLREYELPFCNPDIDVPLQVQKLRSAVRSAQGIILGTPEYHGSFSGVLKNALDWMSFKEFEGKIVGLIGVAGGRLGAINALNSLQNIGRALHAWVIPEQVSIPQAWRLFNADGTLSQPELEERLYDVGKQVARFAYLHSAQQNLEFLAEWEKAPQNPGGAV